jgi:hypothetical protein
MQAACNRTKGAHPFDFDASSMEAQAHTSCNRRAGYYVQETARHLRQYHASSTAEPVPQLEATLRMTQQCQPSTSVTGQSAAGEGLTVDTARNGPAVMAVAGGRKQRSSRQQAHVPSWDSERTLSRGVKTTRLCSVPRTARARTTSAPRATRLVALTLRQDRRHLWQAKQATLHLRHNDRVKKGAPRHLISYPFPLPLSLSCLRDRERGYSEGILLREGSEPRAPLLIRGSKAGPSEGFNSRLRALGLRAHYWSEVPRLAPEGFDSHLRARRARENHGYVRYITKAWATLPRYPSTFPRPTGTIS